MGCSLSAASDMQETRTRLGREANPIRREAKSSRLKKYYILLHSLDRDLKEKEEEKESLGEEIKRELYKDTPEDMFLKYAIMYRNDAFILQHEIDTIKKKIIEISDEILKMTEIIGVNRMDILAVARENQFDY